MSERIGLIEKLNLGALALPNAGAALGAGVGSSIGEAIAGKIGYKIGAGVGAGAGFLLGFAANIKAVASAPISLLIIAAAGMAFPHHIKGFQDWVVSGVAKMVTGDDTPSGPSGGGTPGGPSHLTISNGFDDMEQRFGTGERLRGAGLIDESLENPEGTFGR